MERDGITIRDQWEQKGRREGKRWLARVWDADARKYASKAWDDFKDAERWARNMRSAVAKGDATAIKATLAEVGADYLGRLESAGRCALHVADCKRIIDGAVAAGVGVLTDRQAASRAEKYVATLRVRTRAESEEAPIASPASRKRAMGVLKSVGKFAVERQTYGLKVNPFISCLTPQVRLEARAVYDLDELRRLVGDDQQDHPWRLFAVVTAYTGMRSAEVQAMAWDWIRWDAALIGVPAAVSKTKRPRWVPLQPELAAILRPLAKVGNAPVIEQEWLKYGTQQATRGMLDYLNDLKIERTGRVVHDLRHSVAALLTATGVSSHLVMDHLGHTTTDVSKHYASGAALYAHAVKGWPVGEFYLRRKPPASQAKKVRG